MGNYDIWTGDRFGSGRRYVQTSAVDVSQGGSIEFLFAMELMIHQALVCEDGDAPNEEVYLIYSINNGDNYVQIFDGWDTDR